MSTYYLSKPVYSLFLLFIFFTSCSGQAKTQLQQDNISSSTANPAGQAKISKAHGAKKATVIGKGFQDKAGNIWYCSNGEGVYRYDGKVFTHFTKKDGLDNNIAYSVLEDNSGSIWVGTQTGLNRFDGKAFTHVPMMIPYKFNFNSNSSPDNNPAHPNGVWSMMKDKSGKLWLGTDDGVFCYDGKTFSRFLDGGNIINKSGLQLKAIFSILEDRKGNIWFAACFGDGISRFDGQNLENIIPHEKVKRVNDMIEDKKGTLWFVTSFNGLCRYDEKDFTPNVFKDKKGFMSNVVEDRSGNIWIQIDEEPGRYDGSTLKIFTEKDGLPCSFLSPLLQDRSGYIWFSAPGMGLYRYDGKAFVDFSK